MRSFLWLLISVLIFAIPTTFGLAQDADNNYQEVLRRIERARNEDTISLNLEGLYLQSLPPEIGTLIQIQFLDLSFNRLSSLPPEIANLRQLRSLNLSFNRLSSLPPEIANLRQLRSLDLNSNMLYRHFWFDSDVSWTTPLCIC